MDIPHLIHCQTFEWPMSHFLRWQRLYCDCCCYQLLSSHNKHGFLHGKGGASEYYSFACYLDDKIFTSIKLPVYYSHDHFIKTSALSALKILNLSKPIFTKSEVVLLQISTDIWCLFCIYTKPSNKTTADSPSPVLFRCHWALSMFLKHTFHFTSYHFHRTVPEIN